MTKVWACFPCRTAIISLRREDEKLSEVEPNEYTVVFSEEWSREQFMAYARAAHPGEVVKLVRWHASRDRSGLPKLYLANPRAFRNFKKGEMR